MCLDQPYGAISTPLLDCVPRFFNLAANKHAVFSHFNALNASTIWLPRYLDGASLPNQHTSIQPTAPGKDLPHNHVVQSLGESFLSVLGQRDTSAQTSYRRPN
jgi:hypothetical protein